MGFNCISSLALPIYFYFTVVMNNFKLSDFCIKTVGQCKQGKRSFFQLANSPLKTVAVTYTTKTWRKNPINC